MNAQNNNTAYRYITDLNRSSEFLKIISSSDKTLIDKAELKEDANALDTESRIDLISNHFEEIMRILGLDLSDDSLKDTPKRVAKMYVNEIFSGLNPANKPEITLFENNYNYDEMLLEKNIKVHSYCEHHFVPIIGKAHVAYISSGKVIGLSKINRIVDFFSRRPQVQERLTVQIAEELKKVLQTEDVAVAISADHMCVTMRGIKDQDSSTFTSSLSGKFKEKELRKEFMDQLNSKLH
jgi:GTP cyclohydrolase IA